jgi:hypothetical protein
VDEKERMRGFALDWRVKAAIQKVLWRLPYGVRLNAFLSHLQSGHNPQSELLAKHIPTFFRHWDILSQKGLISAVPETVLEIGTGWDLDVALLMSLAGVRQVITADIIRHVRFAQVCKSLRLFEPLLPDIAARTHRDVSLIKADWERLMTAPSLQRLCEYGRIHYLAPVSASYQEIENESVDICYSTAVFEHIPLSGIQNILNATGQKLRRGGVSSHIIDIKDHFAYFQKGLPYNNFLRYSKQTWEWWADNPMSYLNRLSPAEWRNVFLETGYDVVVFQTFRENTLPSLNPNLLHREQHHRLGDDFNVGEIHVVSARR